MAGTTGAKDATLTIGTRGSLLAMAQTNVVADALRAAWPELDVQVRKIITRGDRQQKVALPQIGGKGLFTAELEAALLDGSIDLAVHSAKDLPTDMPDGIILAATPQREDPRDALISREALALEDLPEGALIGTSSLRRQAQLRRIRPDLRFTVLRGNVDTRIRKVLQRQDCDATLLAMAGLRRTDLTEHVTQALELDVMLPAAGQGALALQARADDERVLALLEPVHHPPTAECVVCERAVIEALQGGCQAPIGVHASLGDGGLDCRACVVSVDGTLVAEARVGAASLEGRDPAEDVVRRLRDAGAEAILAACRE